MKQSKLAEERRIQVCACLVIAFILLAVHFVIPDFYSTLLTLTMAGNVQGLTDYILSFGYGAMAVSILMILLTNMTGLPSLPFLIVNGLIFGLVPGIVVSWIGEVLGNIAGFIVMRTVFRDFAGRLIAKSKRLNRIDSYSSFRNVLIARSLPYTPNVLLTALMASSSVSFADHALATFIGKLPAVAIEVLFGHDLVYIRENADRLLAVLILCLAGYGIYRWKKKSR